jgi:putative SOS response-associated peptidase YedK
MCGRYVLIHGKMILQSFARLYLGSVQEAFDDLPRFNASPMQRMPVIAEREGELVARKMQWWLVPHWSKDGKIKATTFNAKAETLDQSKLFAPYFKWSRCLVPAEAFYEWKKNTMRREVKGKIVEVEEKQPMCIRMKNQSLFMFAGLFSVWKNDKGEEFPSFTIITTTPNTLMSKIHTRMPVILKEKHFDEWLDRENKNIEGLKKLLISYPASPMEVFAVFKYVSNSRNEGPECMKKVDNT